MINRYQLIKNKKKAIVIATGSTLALAAITLSFSGCTAASASTIAVEQTAGQPVFKVVGLGVNPAVIASGDVVQVVASIDNSGNSNGDYLVDLKINGVTDTIEKVNVPPGNSRDVTFQLSRELVRVYKVEVGELSGQFEVKASQADVSASSSPLKLLQAAAQLPVQKVWSPPRHHLLA
jgi:hypothetical protein